MTLRIFDDVVQRSEEWYALRCGLVTASSVGRLITPTLKVADNDASRGLTAQLAAERITGEVDETPVTSDMWRGIEHEPYALEKYAEHHAPIDTTGFMVRTAKTWRLGYSPDALVGKDGLVEVKCPRAKGHLQTILADEVPAQHMAQLQAGLLVSGRKWVDFVSFRAGMPLYVKRVRRSSHWFTAILKAVEQFEANATGIVADYEERTKDMPKTERISFDLEVA